jgi:HNH endonuclease
VPAHKLSTDTERFWLKVDKTSRGCWLWTGSVNSHGYGQLGIGSRAQGTFKMQGAHRFALELKLGRPIAPGMCALHTCDNPACVRPAHLWEGTTQDNTADREAKGRGAKINGAVLHPERLSRGSQRYNAAFTERDIRVIRRRVAAGERPIDLASEYGVCNTTIHKIVHRQSWQHVA